MMDQLTRQEEICESFGEKVAFLSSKRRGGHEPENKDK